MGIRFACHVCGKQLNIKRELGGRRGVCPACATRFRIPLEDTATSSPVEAKVAVAAQSMETNEHSQSHAHGQSTAAVADSEFHAETSEGSDLGARQQAEPAQQVERDFTPVGDPMGQDAAEDLEAASPEAETREVPSSLAGDRIASISALDDDPHASWYVRPPSGGQYGPASVEILRQWIDEGRVAATALLWREGWPQWRDASDALPELAARLPDGTVASRVQSVGAQAAVATETGATALSGQADVGTARRARSMKRVMLVGVLTALAATLVGVLVVVVNRTSG